MHCKWAVPRTTDGVSREIPQVGFAGVTRPPRKHSHYSRATVVVWHLLLPVYASHGWIPFMWKCPYVITYKWQPRGVTSMRLLLLYSSPLSGQAVSYSISFYPSHITITQVLLNIFIVIHVWVGKVYVSSCTSKIWCTHVHHILLAALTAWRSKMEALLKA